MASLAPPVEGPGPSPAVVSASSVPSAPPTGGTVLKRSPWEPLFSETNVVTMAGGGCIFLAGLLYAVQEVAYDELAGASVPNSYNWVFDVQGLAYFLFGLGILLAFRGLARGWPSIGGGLAFFGSVLMAVGDAAYAALRGHGPLQDTGWTGTFDAVGFLLLATGIAVAVAALAVVLPRRMPDLFR